MIRLRKLLRCSLFGALSGKHRRVVAAAAAVVFQGALTGTALGGWEVDYRPMAPRAGAASQVVDGKIYLLGGGNSQTPHLTTVEVYDPATDSWTTRASMPTGRSGMATGLINGKLYVAGGRIASLTATAAMEEYNPATDTWTPRAPLPVPLVGMAFGVIQNKLYVAGGLSNSMATDTVYEYDPASDRWNTKTPAPTARANLVGGVIGEKLYLTGARVSYDDDTAPLEAYDPVTDTWTSGLAPMAPRSGCASGVFDGRLYVVGGTRTDIPEWQTWYYATMEEYDPVANAWTTRAPMPVARSGAGSGVVNGRLYVLGGYDGRFVVDTVLAYNFATPDTCTLLIGPETSSVAGTGGTKSFSVWTPDNCPWSAVSGAQWLTITSGAASTNGTVTYSAAPNPLPTSRTGTITVSGRIHTVTQAGARPGNDALGAAFEFSGSSGSAHGTNLNGTKEQAEPNHGGQTGGASVWWSWTAPESGVATITTEGSSFDTLLGVYTDGLTLLNSIAQSASAGGGAAAARVRFAASAGTTYRIAVDGVQGATGSITLNWSTTPFARSSHRSVQRMSVVTDGGGYEELVYNYTTGDSHKSGYKATPDRIPYFPTPGQWIGIYHYDYGTARFTQALYSTSSQL